MLSRACSMLRGVAADCAAPAMLCIRPSAPVTLGQQCRHIQGLRPAGERHCRAFRGHRFSQLYGVFGGHRLLARVARRQTTATSSSSCIHGARVASWSGCNPNECRWSAGASSQAGADHPFKRSRWHVAERPALTRHSCGHLCRSCPSTEAVVGCAGRCECVPRVPEHGSTYQPDTVRSARLHRRLGARRTLPNASSPVA